MTVALSASTWAEDPEDFSYLNDHIQEVLEFEQIGVESRWRNPKTGKGGSILVERTYSPDLQTPCRDFVLTFDAEDAEPRTTDGTGCRSPEGDWQLTDGPAPSSVSEIKRNWAWRKFTSNVRRGDGSILDDPTEERRPSEAISKEQKTGARVQSATKEPSTDLETQAQLDCDSDARGGSSIETKELDLVVLLDTTRTMQDQFGAIQAELVYTVTALRRMVPSLNVGLVAYRDRTDAYLTRTFQLAPMTERNLRRLETFIERLRAEGGGNPPEAIGEALGVAKGMAWRPTALGQIVAITDAQGHHQVRKRTFSMVRSFYSSAPAGEGQRRLSAIYSGTWRNRQTIDFLRRLAESGGGCFLSHQGRLIGNALMSILKWQPS